MVGQGGGRRGEKGRDLYFPEYTIFLFCIFFPFHKPSLMHKSVTIILHLSLRNLRLSVKLRHLLKIMELVSDEVKIWSQFILISQPESFNRRAILP